MFTQDEKPLSKTPPPRTRLEERLMKFAQNCIASSLGYTQDVVANLERMRDLYAGNPRYNPPENKNLNYGERVEITELEVGESHFPNTHTGEAAATVQSAVAAFVAAIFSSDRFHEAVPYNEGDKARAEIVRDAITYATEQQHHFCGQPFKQIVEDSATRMFKYPSSIVKTGVATKIANIEGRGPQLIGNPFARVVPRQNILVANPARCGLQRQDQPYIAEYFTPMLEDLYEHERRDIPIEVKVQDVDPYTQQPRMDENGEPKVVTIKGVLRTGVYQNLQGIESNAGAFRSEHSDQTSTAETGSTQISDSTQTLQTEYQFLKAWEIWARNPIPRWLRLKQEQIDESDVRELAKKWEIDEKKLFSAMEDLVITYVEPNSLIAVRTNWFDHQRRPYHSVRYEDLDNRFDGLSLLQRQDALQEMQDSILSLVYQDCRRLLNGSYFRDSRALISDDDLKKAFTPGGNCPVDLSNVPGMTLEKAFFPIPANDFLQVALPLMAKLSSMMQRVTIPADVQGVGTSATATEARINATTGTQKLNMAFDRYVRSILLPVLEDFRDLLRQYKDTEEMIRVFGEGGLRWQPVSPEDLKTKVDIKIIADLSVGDNNLKAQYITNVLNVAGNKTPLEYYLNMLRAVLRLLRFREDQINSWLPKSDKESPPEEENIALERNKNVPVRVTDNHAKHIIAHSNHPRTTQATGEHIVEHLKAQAYMSEMAERSAVDPAQAAKAAELTTFWADKTGGAVGGAAMQAMIQNVSRSAQQTGMAAPQAQESQPGAPPPQDNVPDQTQTLGLGY